MDNFISVDLEEWYHFGFADEVTEKKRKALSGARIVHNTLKLLNIFDTFNVQATFFVLGVIAVEFPDLIQEIEKRGHEIASHGFTHTPIFRLKKDEFELELKKSLDILRPLVKQGIIGYRAPYFSLKENFWVYDVLAENGFLYDSSLKNQSCVRMKQIGSGTYEILTTKEKVIAEFPVSTIRIFNWRLQFSGGTYFRMLSSDFLKLAIKRLNQQGKAANFYLHPRDIDSSLPKLKLNYFNQLKYSGRLGNTEEKLKSLFRVFKFIPMGNSLRCR